MSNNSNKKKKNLAKGSFNPQKDVTDIVTTNEETPEDNSSQKRLAIMGFAFLGLVMSFLWGANSVVDVGHSTSPLVQAAKVSMALATNKADFDKGLAFGFVGAMLGGCFGYSIFLESRVMLSSLGIGLIGLIVGCMIGSPLVAGLFWLIGYASVVFPSIAKDLPTAKQ